jgi:ribonuclease D
MEIVKVFHDFCEDASALVNQFHVKCQGVFDTQIANRVIDSEGKTDYRNNNIGLN